MWEEGGAAGWGRGHDSRRETSWVLVQASLVCRWVTSLVKEATESVRAERMLRMESWSGFSSMSESCLPGRVSIHLSWCAGGVKVFALRCLEVEADRLGCLPLLLPKELAVEEVFLLQE